MAGLAEVDSAVGVRSRAGDRSVVEASAAGQLFVVAVGSGAEALAGADPLVASAAEALVAGAGRRFAVAASGMGQAIAFC